jgi:hypothetical protein
VLLLLLQVSATQDVEARVCERLHIGGHVSYRRLLEDMAGLGYSNQQVGGHAGACGLFVTWRCAILLAGMCYTCVCIT